MKIKLHVDNPRLNEFAGILLLLLAVGVLLSLASYSPADPSINVATGTSRASNWMGLPGSYGSDLILQALGLSGFLFPAWLAAVGWSRIRHVPPAPAVRGAFGGVLLTLVCCCTLQLLIPDRADLLPSGWQSTIQAGGTIGKVLTDLSISTLNFGGTILALLAGLAVSIYALTSWRIGDFLGFGRDRASADDELGPEPAEESVPIETRQENAEVESTDSSEPDFTIVPEGPAASSDTAHSDTGLRPGSSVDGPPWTEEGTTGDSTIPPTEPPIVPYEGTVHDSTLGTSRDLVSDEAASAGKRPTSKRVRKPQYKLPQTSLLNAPFAKQAYDPVQLQRTGQQIVEKLEEFSVRGSVNQINPGPVVTTFEFKPDRGVKVSKIIGLAEDLCLGLECESILVERIPGRPTVGIEVPNRNREVISLREVIDSPTFRQTKSLLTFALGKDINGKIHCADLAGMPHLLVAGQTGSGKSVMVNCVIMSILLRTTPEEVRFILVDPKTVELALYRDVPHLLTPVITDMKKANNALRNATREMDRRLQLLAQYGVRNISQFNEKIAKLKAAGSDGENGEEVQKLPYIVVIVDELADLMMLAGRQVEEAIQRLAQMARAVGIHLLLATQRPSVDVITGLIKANIPARMSFLLATRVDSRTIIDSIGAESLLGKGDMLFLPPGAPRIKRLHGPLVSEDEIEAVVSHWKELASPEYENDYLESPDGEAEESDSGDEGAFDDPMYRDAVQLVLDMGKASTSTLQRRLRLGYGRAARILDAMEKDGIIGPPDGSRPREVLKRPDWLDEVQSE